MFDINKGLLWQRDLLTLPDVDKYEFFAWSTSSDGKFTVVVANPRDYDHSTGAVLFVLGEKGREMNRVDLPRGVTVREMKQRRSRKGYLLQVHDSTVRDSLFGWLLLGERGEIRGVFRDEQGKVTSETVEVAHDDSVAIVKSQGWLYDLANVLKP